MNHDDFMTSEIVMCRRLTNNRCQINGCKNIAVHNVRAMKGHRSFDLIICDSHYVHHEEENSNEPN